MRSRRKSGSLSALIAIALLLVGAARAASVAVPSFSKQKTYRTGSNGGLTGIADLNGDRFPDLVALEGQHFAVLLNTGHGTFGGKSDYQTGPSPSAALGDLNGDGRPELVSANGANDTVSVLLNRGDGSYAARQDFATGADPTTLSIADANGDGKADVVTGNGGGTVSVLLGNGDGALQARRDYPVRVTSNVGFSLLVTDLNGDGKLDLATAAGSVSVLLNSGDGTFQPAHEYSNAGTSLAVGDMNGDTSLDLVATWLGGSDSVTVLFNRGDGRFPRRRAYVIQGGILPPSGYVTSATVADLNGDGRPDLVTVDEDSGPQPVGVSVLRNRGDGTFARHDYLRHDPEGTSEDSASVTIGDVNGDGRPDLTLPDGDNSVALFLNKRDGTFQARSDYRVNPFAVRVVISDLNRDGRPDVISASEHGDSDAVSVLLNKPGLCNVQDVRSLRLTAARTRLARVHCRVGAVRRIYDARVNKSRVISQQPMFGAVLPGGGRVDVVVSLGPRR